MSSGTGILSRLIGLLVPPPRCGGGSRRSRHGTAQSNPRTGTAGAVGQSGITATVEIGPPGRDELTISYAPHHDGAPDAGEIVWTWVPYQENDGRGKDRPVLVIARGDAAHVFAVKLTSKSHEGDRDFLSIGSGPWDGQGRESWVDIDQVYRVHDEGLRREAAALDRERFAQVATVLHRRYGWAVQE